MVPIPTFISTHILPAVIQEETYRQNGWHLDTVDGFNAKAHMGSLLNQENISPRFDCSMALGNLFRQTETVPLYHYADNTLLLWLPNGTLELVSLDDLDGVGSEDHPLRKLLTPTFDDNGESLPLQFACLAFKQVQIKNSTLGH